jgi:hypothetical protein
MLKAKSVERVLEELVELRRRQQAGVPLLLPLVTLHLRSGRDIQGHVLDVVEERQGVRSLLLHVPGPDVRSPREDALYLSTHVVEALTLHGAPRAGTVSEAALPPPPSALQLRRRLEEVRRALALALGVELEAAFGHGTDDDTPDTLRALGELLGRAQGVLQRLAADPLGHEALREKVRRLVLAVGNTPTVTLVAGTLTLTNSPQPVHWQTAQDLERELMAAL